MSRKKLDFTLEEVVEELVFIANGIAEAIMEGFGKNFYLAALNYPLQSYADNDDTGCREFTVNDLKDSPLCYDISCAYDYALGLRYGDINNPEDFLDGMGGFTFFAQSVIGYIEDSKYKFLYDLTSARATLDNGDYLNLKELALLASVDERTVRNVASSKDANRLNTKKSGGSTIIENEEAKRWLSSRPDFKPTQYIEDTSLDTPRYFEDEPGFGRFLTFRREELGLSIEDVANSINVESEKISDLEKGIDRLYINQVSKLADVLKEDASLFMKDYMRIFHIEELANLLDFDYKPAPNSEYPEKFIKFKLAIFKTQLKLKAQIQVIESQNK